MLKIFVARKIRRLQPGLNPQTWVPEASMLATRPLKPLEFFTYACHKILSLFKRERAGLWRHVKLSTAYRLYALKYSNFPWRSTCLIPSPLTEVREGKIPLMWVPVTTAWRVLRLRKEERPPIWRVALNKLNKQPRTADEGWSSSFGVGRGANNPSP
jgi:hypothetical protein